MTTRYSVVIPSAILVPESLRAVGNLPAIVYPLNKGTVLDSLYAQYADAGEIVIVASQGVEEVRRRLGNGRYPNVRVVELPELGDLCDTVRFGLESLEDEASPVIVNFSDTVASGDILNVPNGFYASSERLSPEWTFFAREGSGVSVTYDRSEEAAKQSGKADAFVGVFRLDDPRAFLRAVNEMVASGGVSHFYRALERYGRRVGLVPLEPEDWLDIGHPSGYVSAQLQVKAREFNHIQIDRDRAILCKSSDNADKFIGEIKWYLKLPAEVSYVAPRIFSYSLDWSDPWVRMEYYPYHTLHTLWLNGQLDRARWAAVFDRIGFVLRDFARYQVHDDPAKVSGALRSMYLDKTVSRLERLRQNRAFAPFFDAPIVVNGRRHPSLARVEEELGGIVPRALCAGDTPLCLIHGDLCFANMMIDDSLSFVRLIDPRGSFGPYDIYGDQRYELAKLAHSVDGKYDLIIKEEFDLHREPGSNSIDFEIHEPEGPDLYAVMRECLADLIGDRLPQVELIEATLFLSMIPLHGESLEQQLVMLGTGLELLERARKGAL